MFNLLYYLLFISCLFSEDFLFSIGDHRIYKHDFFQKIAYSEWIGLDSLGQSSFSDSFVSKELSYIEALSLGLDVYPENFIKLQQRFNQLLINSTYESLVAHPLIKENDFLLAKQNIKEKVLVHHILVGFSGCKLPGLFDRNQEEAHQHIKQLQKKLSILFVESPRDSLVSIFSSFAFPQ